MVAPMEALRAVEELEDGDTIAVASSSPPATPPEGRGSAKENLKALFVAPEKKIPREDAALCVAPEKIQREAAASPTPREDRSSAEETLEVAAPPWTVRLVVVDDGAPLALRLRLGARQRRRPLGRLVRALERAYAERYAGAELDASRARREGGGALALDVALEAQLEDGAAVVVPRRAAAAFERVERVELDDDVLPPLAVRLASLGRGARVGAAEAVATYENILRHLLRGGADAYGAAQAAAVSTVKAIVERETVAAAPAADAPDLAYAYAGGRAAGAPRAAPPRLRALIASHVDSDARLRRFARMVASLRAQRPPPSGGGLVAVSASTGDLLRRALDVVAEEGPAWLEAAPSRTPRTQFQHYAALAALAAARDAAAGAPAGDSWCLLADDDDVWHPRRSAAYAAAAAHCRDDVSVVVSSWLARPAFVGGAAVASPSDVDAAIASGAARTTDDGSGRKLEEYFQYGVRGDVMAAFFTAAGPALLASQYCDIAFYNFLRRRGTCQRFRPRSGFERNWMYFYDKPFPGAPPSPRGAAPGDDDGGARASTAVAHTAADVRDARDHAARAADAETLADLFCHARGAAAFFVAVFGGAPAPVSRGAFEALGAVVVRAHLAAIGWRGALLDLAVDHRAARLPGLAAESGLRLD